MRDVVVAVRATRPNGRLLASCPAVRSGRGGSPTAGGAMPTDQENTPTRSGVSRRSVLTGAGVAVSGAALATVGTSGAEASEVVGAVSTGPRGTTVTEFRGRIEQTGSSGQSFSSLGFVYATHGADADDL